MACCGRKKRQRLANEAEKLQFKSRCEACGARVRKRRTLIHSVKVTKRVCLNGHEQKGIAHELEVPSPEVV